jgi:hypothetical protein
MAGTHTPGSWRQEGLTLVMALAVAPSFKEEQRVSCIALTTPGTSDNQDRGLPSAPT